MMGTHPALCGRSSRLLSTTAAAANRNAWRCPAKEIWRESFALAVGRAARGRGKNKGRLLETPAKRRAKKKHGGREDRPHPSKSAQEPAKTPLSLRNMASAGRQSAKGGTICGSRLEEIVMALWCIYLSAHMRLLYATLIYGVWAEGNDKRRLHYIINFIHPPRTHLSMP